MRLPVIAVLAASAIAATPVAAATLIGATSIVVTNSQNTYLQVAELQAFSPASVNVAAAINGGSAVGTSVYDPFSSADKAIDGNTGGDYYTDTIYHGLTDGGDTLTVSFAAANLSSLTIFGRTDCCSFRDTYNVTVLAGATVLYSGVLDATDVSGTVTFVPEPATWALMIAGFAMTGMSLRRRNAAVAA